MVRTSIGLNAKGSSNIYHPIKVAVIRVYNESLISNNVKSRMGRIDITERMIQYSNEINVAIANR
ncbi:MAG: hypothetical protein IIB40_05170 [Candidatus Marinimicrobia bacterium]|nr:hypothetical protein [Candidatus Neomarinimicrobiota bacterium]